jgi:CheY-like chemotaxis protein
MPRKILVADDNDDLRSILGYQLQARGFTIVMASDGRQAVDKAKAEKPDLILLDVLMPIMDGTEAGALLREDPVTANIPVIFLTALVQGAEGGLGGDPQEMGGRIAVPKSISVEDLISKIEQVLLGGTGR